MITLTTGKPNTGKSTAIHKIAHMLGKKRCAGLLASEIIDNNDRVGFSTQGIRSGQSIVLAHKNIDKKYAVEDFGVDIKALEEVATREFDIALSDDSVKFIIIDEIGRMQVMSERFRQYLNQIRKSDKQVVATICYEDEIDYIRDFKKGDDIRLIVLDQSNRDNIPLEVIKDINKDDSLYLSKIDLALKYRNEKERYTYDKDKIIMKSTHDTRIITREDGIYRCTCEYYSDNGVCSHILSILLKEK